MTPDLTPVELTVTVDGDAALAFEVFTDGMASWWPVPSHSIGESRVVDIQVEPFEGGLVVEVWDDGTRAPWADVLVWEPPHRLALAWNAGAYGERPPTRVDVAFVETDGRTAVTLVHSGWEVLGDAAAENRAGYAEGWVVVLGAYVARLTP